MTYTTILCTAVALAAVTAVSCASDEDVRRNIPGSLYNDDINSERFILDHEIDSNRFMSVAEHDRDDENRFGSHFLMTSQERFQTQFPSHDDDERFVTLRPRDDDDERFIIFNNSLDDDDDEEEYDDIHFLKNPKFKRRHLALKNHPLIRYADDDERQQAHNGKGRSGGSSYADDDVRQMVQNGEKGGRSYYADDDERQQAHNGKGRSGGSSYADDDHLPLRESMLHELLKRDPKKNTLLTHRALGQEVFDEEDQADEAIFTVV